MCNHGRTEIPTGIWWGNLKERDYKEDLGVDERIILKLILNRVRRCRLAQDRYNFLSVMNTVMHFRVPKCWEFLD
jgi:hypothetical protein